MALGHAVSGSLATAIATFFTYPLDLVNTRLKVQGRLSDGAGDAGYGSIADAFRKIYAREGGITAFFAGLPTDLAKSVLDAFLFFLFYNYLRARLRQRRRQLGVTKRSLSPIQELAVGAIAGACSRAFTTPVANVVTKRQTAGVSAQQRRDLSFFESMAEIRRERGGVLGLWAGYSATLVLTLNPSITFFLQDALATAVAGGELDDDDAGPGFLLAAVSKGVATAIMYPFQAAKARVQVAPSNEKTGPNSKDPIASAGTGFTQGNTLAKGVRSMVTNSIFSTVLQIASTEGIRALYDGVGGEILKAFFSHGITMLSKGAVHKLVLQVYITVVILVKKHPELLQKLLRGRQDALRHIRLSSSQLSMVAANTRRRAIEAIWVQLGSTRNPMTKLFAS